MDFLTLILVAFGLAADAFAVAVTNGMYCPKFTKKHALSTGLAFGFFQALMPILGYFLGRSFSQIVHRFQHWVALILLGAIGINMLAEAFKEKQDSDENRLPADLFHPRKLIMQGIATSIDALAAGVSFAVLEMSIFTASILIGVITLLCCYLGVYIGRMFGTLLGRRARLLGGIVLILIGMKIFIENQFY